MAIPAEKVFRKIMTPGQRAEAARRAAERAELYVTLQALRKARELTQVQLANILGKNQAAITQLEKRTDMLLSTLRAAVLMSCSTARTPRPRSARRRALASAAC